MAELMKVNGMQIKCMDMEYSSGQTEDNMMVTLKSITLNFIGNYCEDKKSGFGKFRWPDGSTYEGNFRDGK